MKKAEEAVSETAATNEWPRWFFGPAGASKIFESAEDVPEGWVDHPSKVPDQPIDL